MDSINLWDEKALGNKRTVKTKKAIFRALFDLIKEKDLDRITVTELAERASVDRKTFYHYYKNARDVVGECEDLIIGSIVSFMRQLREERPDHRIEFFDIFNRILIEKLDFVDQLLHAGAMDLFGQKAIVAFKSELLLIIEQDLQDWSEHDRAILELGCLELSSGVISLYLNWFENHRDITLEEIGRLAKRICKSTIISDYLPDLGSYCNMGLRTFCVTAPYRIIQPRLHPDFR